MPATACSSEPTKNPNDFDHVMKTLDLDVIEEAPEPPLPSSPNLDIHVKNCHRNSQQREWSSIRTVSQFISGVGSTLRELFKIK